MKKKIIWGFIIILIIIINYIGHKKYTNMNEEKMQKQGNPTINNIETTEESNIISSIGVSEFKNELEDGDKILIDIRTKEELDMFGLIGKDALHLDIYNPNFSTELDKLDKSKKYLIYCYHGNRTKSALDMMKQKGFNYAKDLNGGIDSWINNGEKVF